MRLKQFHQLDGEDKIPINAGMLENNDDLAVGGELLPKAIPNGDTASNNTDLDNFLPDRLMQLTAGFNRPVSVVLARQNTVVPGKQAAQATGPDPHPDC